ncbi:EmrB/QacA subfamily drug resistance transporter [Motilibacter rhizosphaerae]|uniref:EmrB/QacA subfamily drug resistance transporter n=1 Tax=Motilibacter rhizosphaerae TaxID=598652 RepID=A0A4Q7NRI1_9ACTN|nr:DHA2 family efflux MFS transporter permease subunit [Motilibacter rhizosphaerae]RZS89651.1 EmrB/QacA subfamily drug resistance transporter [Motilibacter rhizosphaerae]
MTATSASAAEREEAAYAWRVLSVTSLGVILTGLNTSTLDVGLPAVSRHFGASPAQASWFLLAYMLVNTTMILVFGRVADLVGRRRLYVTGLAGFTLASLACGAAPTAGALIAFRAVQAVGAAAIITNTTALLTDAFPRRLLSTALGLNITIISAAQVAGPVVGGGMVEAFGWRAVFLFNVPFGVAGVVWALLTLRSSPATAQGESFDVLGAVLSALALGGLVVALSQGGATGWASPAVVGGALVALVALPAFLALQVSRPRRGQDPLVDLRLFADRERAMAYLAVFLLAVSRFAVVLLVSLFLQAAQGLDALQAGVRVLPVALGMMLVSPVAGRLAQRVPPRLLGTAGLLLSAAGLLVLAVAVRPSLPGSVVAPALLAVGIGTGLFMTPNTSAIMASVPPARRGIANGLRSMLQNTGFVVSTAMSLAIVTSPLTPGEKRAAYAGTLSSLPGHELGAFVDGYRTAFVVLAALCVLGAVASLLRGDGKRVTVRAASGRLPA